MKKKRSLKINLLDAVSSYQGIAIWFLPKPGQKSPPPSLYYILISGVYINLALLSKYCDIFSS